MAARWCVYSDATIGPGPLTLAGGTISLQGTPGLQTQFYSNLPSRKYFRKWHRHLAFGQRVGQARTRPISPR